MDEGWQGKWLKDVVFNILQHLDFDTFLLARVVCKRWAIQSYKCDSQWLQWLEHHGPTSGYTWYDHNPDIVNCQQPCNNQRHYLNKKRHTKVLKTIAPWLQVFQQVVRRRHKKARKIYEQLAMRREHFENLLASTKRSLDLIRIEEQSLSEDMQALNNCRSLAKRRRISISKHV